MQSSEQWTDLIDDFVEYAEGIHSPDIFKLWSAISMIGGALERRVWLKMGHYITYPTLYIMLVAHPGIGKGVIEVVRRFWRDTCEPGSALRVMSVASDSVTGASLLDELAEAKNIGLRANAPPDLAYHSLAIAAEEFSVFLPMYDNVIIGRLIKLYNNEDMFRETRRTGTKKLTEIPNPQINFLIGAQPGILSTNLPDQAWTSGFMSRFIMVFGSKIPPKDLFDVSGREDALRQKILAKLGRLTQLYGQMQWVPEAAQMIGDWHLAEGPPTPTHSKLEHYNQRRTSLHLPRLTMISAIARTGRLVVEPIDVSRAMTWLLQAESLMPDIFRAMIGKSDFQVIEELHYFVMQQWARDKTKLVHERLIWAFLQQRVPAYAIQKLIESAERSGYIKREGVSQFYKPLPKFKSGLE